MTIADRPPHQKEPDIMKNVKIIQIGSRFIVSARISEKDNWVEVEDIGTEILAIEFAESLDGDPDRLREYVDESVNTSEGA